MINSNENRKKLRLWHIIVIILLVLVLGGLAAIWVDSGERNELTALTIENIDFSNLKDGVYVGEYSGTKGHFRDAAVELTITGGEMQNIKILKGALDNNGNPTELSEGVTILDLFQKAKNSQSLQVDAISGATLTSKAHLKALENALKKAKEEN
ncbi:MAG: FMN-binding domain protein [Anaerocolumna sp.]|jgi:uncharacterized protein with FMN-binding domain|nr:FMN-binding domain protein [Anaerocolumna sp.]